MKIVLAGDTYKSIAEATRGLYKDNGSRFISLAYPVQNEQEIKALIDAAKKEYHDASHHCFAYRLGLEGENCRSADDGEPAGSAGRQILSQILSASLSDILVVVVRYFGGVKLGIPGLIRAYRSSTADALNSARIVEKVASDRYRLVFPYEKLPQVMKIAKDMDLGQSNRVFDNECSLDLCVRRNLQDEFFERIDKLTIFIEKIN